jgi:hypothetical protein
MRPAVGTTAGRPRRLTPARTADGLDVQTATKYTGPFVLTELLLPYLSDRVDRHGPEPIRSRAFDGF